MQTVIVPLDGSTTANRALRVGFGMAQRMGAEVLVVGVCEGREGAAVEAELEAAAAPFASVARHSVAALEGKAKEVLPGLAARPDSLMCLATHGRGGLARLALGSVAEAVVAGCGVPVLLVGPGGVDFPLPEERVRMVVGTDDSDAGAVVLSAAGRFASTMGASVEVVQVIGPDEDVDLRGGPQPHTMRERTADSTARSASEIAELGVEASSAVLHGNPGDAIVSHAATIGASFVVVGTSGRSGLTRLTLGSVATAVVRHARCPVLVVCTSGARGAGASTEGEGGA